MPIYAEEARKRYDRKEISAEEMIRQVYTKAKDWSDKHSQPQHLANRCIQALFKLTNSSHQKYYFSKDIFEEIKMEINQNPQFGFYVWNYTGCGIVNEANDPKRYGIKDEFLNPLKKVLESMNNTH
jgi:hypothetical protein